MAPLLKLIWASYQHNILRMVLVFIALITACAGLSAVLVINSAAKNSYAAASQPFLQQVEQRIIAQNGHVLSKQDFTSLRRFGFTQLIPVLRSSNYYSPHNWPASATIVVGHRYIFDYQLFHQ
jgi:putative ABC transport system permease protein